MRRVAIAAMLLAALAFPAAASAHPSEGRNDNGSAGPHCHVNQQSGHLVYPSHKGHAATNRAQGGNAVFMAVACP